MQKDGRYIPFSKLLIGSLLYEKIFPKVSTINYYIVTVITDEGFIIGKTFGIREHDYVEGNTQPPGCYESHFLNSFGESVSAVYKSEEEAIKDTPKIMFNNWEEDRIIVKPISQETLR